jgi:hypothetical protein
MSLPEAVANMIGQGQESNQSSFRQKLFKPQFLDIEQIILHMIEAISLSALLVKDVGDAKQANAAFTALVLNLDSFVFPLLTAEDQINWTKYITDRKMITDKWKITQDAGESPSNSARELYKLTVETLARQRLFKVRRMVYFGVGWYRGQQINMNELVGMEEKDGEVETDLTEDNIADLGDHLDADERAVMVALS